MIDPVHIGRMFGPYSYHVTREQIRGLALALGDQNPIYHDPAAALAAGWADLPAPPTLATCYGLWANPALLAELETLGAPLLHMLHGEQRYAYHTPVLAGDTLTARPTIIAIVHKNGRSGPMTILTLETSLHNQRHELAIVDRLVVVVRHAE
jgi:acyl dehydratase